MGANIDYAIIITGRYQDLKQKIPPKEAIIEALNQAFPTVLTSGTILASAGLLIGFFSSEYSISSIGLFLGRGTIISMFLVMGILPQILLLGNNIIDKTGFKLKSLPESKKLSGQVEVNGHIRGHISGIIDAEVQGSIKGDVDAIIKTNSKKKSKNNYLKEEKEDEKDDK